MDETILNLEFIKIILESKTVSEKLIKCGFIRDELIEELENIVKLLNILNLKLNSKQDPKFGLSSIMNLIMKNR